MASSSIVLVNLADENVTFSLAGQTANGALYKDATRSLALPRSLEFNFNVGQPGSLGNDKLTITLADTVQNATTGKVVTARVKVEISVPRDSAMTQTIYEDLLAHVTSLLTDARIQNIADAVVP